MAEAEKERAAVVAWLRGRCVKIASMPARNPIELATSEGIIKIVNSYADAIARGKHMAGAHSHLTIVK